METIIAASGGINWCWYHWFEIDGKTVRETRANRWHRFENRGGEAEPNTKWSVTFFNWDSCTKDYWRDLCGRVGVEQCDKIAEFAEWVDGQRHCKYYAVV